MGYTTGQSLIILVSWLTVCLDGGISGFSCGARPRPNSRPERTTTLQSISTDKADSSSTPSSIRNDEEDPMTEVSIKIPKFYHGEVPEGTYPSPLHSIHVESILTLDEAAKCRSLAKEYAAQSGCWDGPDSIRHSTYATCDFPMDECETLSQYLDEIGFHDEILSRLSQHYHVDVEDMSYLDFFCAHYQAKNNDSPNNMDQLEAHRDGSILSFTVLLTPPDEFEGGGTFFDALVDVQVEQDDGVQVLFPKGVIRAPQAGDCVLHSGKLLHGADVVTSGERTVLVGFVEVGDWCLRPDVLARACTDFGRMDVAKYRYNRQKLKTTDNQNGWMLNNSRWLVDSNTETGEGRSYIRGFCPIFPSVASRADPEYQRMKRLQAEDVLLRSILLPEKRPIVGFSDADITIL